MVGAIEMVGATVVGVMVGLGVVTQMLEFVVGPPVACGTSVR